MKTMKGMKPEFLDKLRDPKIAVLAPKMKSELKLNTRSQDPPGYHLRPIEGLPAESEDAVWFMGTLLERSGIDMSLIPDWRANMRIAETDIVHTGSKVTPKSVIYPGTLYLRIDYNYKGGKLTDIPELPGFKIPADVIAEMRSDPEAEIRGKRLRHDLRILRVWLEIWERRFRAGNPPLLDSPMARLWTKPDHVHRLQYHVPLTNMDVIAP